MREPIWNFLTRPHVSGIRRLSYPIRAGLVAIPFLLIALAILCPIYQTARPKSRQASCMSNQKQIFLGLLMYAEDYNETFPVGTRSNRLSVAIVKDTPYQARFHVGQGWAGQVNPYIKNVQVYQCPEDEREAIDGLYPVSFAYNRNIALKPLKAEMIQPEATILLAETSGNFVNMTDANEHNAGHTNKNIYSAAGNGLNILAATDGATEPEASAGARYVTGIMGRYGTAQGCSLWPLAAPQDEKPRHNEGTLFAFVDGHVKYLKPPDVSPGDNATDAKQAQDCTNHRAAGTANLGGFKATFSTK